MNIGYINPWPPRHTLEAQQARLKGDAYIEDRSGRVIDALIRSMRKGKVVMVVELGLLAPVTGRPSKRREALAERVEAIRQRGGHIMELATGHNTKTGQLPRMMIRASEFIATSGRVGGRREGAGRPGVELTPQERELAAGLWGNRRFGNDMERLSAIHKRIGKKLKRGWCWRYFGSPSGRTE